MNTYLVKARHFLEGYKEFEIKSDDKLNALIKGREYIRKTGGGNYDLKDIKVIKKLNK